MTGVVARYMSSTYAIDSAWDMLHSDDKIEKVLPLAALAVPAIFGGLGAFSGAGGRFINPETGKVDPGLYADPKFQDPLTGGLIGERKVGGDSKEDRMAGAAVGALQGLNPISLAGRALKPASRGAKRLRAGKSSPTVTQVSPGVTDTTFSRRQVLNNGIRDRAARGLDVAGKYGQKGLNVAGRGAQFAGFAEEQGLGDLAAGLAGGYAMGKLPQAPTTGFAAQMGTTGAAPTQGTQVSGNADPYALREIYKPQTGSAFEGQKEFGGLGVQKGDNMFRKNIGEELLNEAAYRLHKAHCGTELKADCPKDCKGCPKCDGDNKKKADDKKKPAHGMVIVIGSKAGPGPSTDGKRDKLDSEKKKE